MFYSISKWKYCSRKNIAMGQTTPAEVMNDWMHSKVTWKIFLGIAGDYTTIGIGCF